MGYTPKERRLVTELATKHILTPDTVEWLERLSRRLLAEWGIEYEVDDFAQDVAEKALKAIFTYRGSLADDEPTQVRAWLKTIAVNWRTDLYRRTTSRPAYADVDVYTVAGLRPDGSPQPDEQVLSDVTVRETFAALTAAGFPAGEIVSMWCYPGSVRLQDLPGVSSATAGFRLVEKARQTVAPLVAA